MSIGLSPLLVDELFDINGQIRESGITVLLIEQNVQQTLEIADRAYVLANVRVVLQGGGPALLENDLLKEAYLGL
jgi:branched-chain amino acid transport system ATP-binding protein